MIEVNTPFSVKALREKRRWTRQQLAAQADIAASTLLRMERGQVVARKGFESVCKALGVKPEQVQGVSVRTEYGRECE